MPKKLGDRGGNIGKVDRFMCVPTLTVVYSVNIEIIIITIILTIIGVILSISIAVFSTVIDVVRFISLSILVLPSNT